MFKNAIQELEASGCNIGDPEPFQAYLSRNNLGSKNTAQYISINEFTDLHQDLIGAECMVYRLGSSKGSKQTRFALAKYKSGWFDYFFIDQTIFEGSDAEIFLPNASVRSMFAYQLFPKLTETSLVNLALASGLLPDALNITPSNEPVIPATGQSTFTFDFRPRSDESIVLSHLAGQVEIDAVFVGQREGKECLFVVEAKASEKMGSLAKHKLLYPMLALQNHVPSELEVVPVYMRAVRGKGAIEFNIAECFIPIVNGQYGAMDEFVVKSIKRYTLLGYS